MFFGIMVLIVLVLFNSIKKTLVIWLTVPLAMIGVTAGLLAFNQPFGFMALLGLMSLSGMAIKASIVLVDEIDIQIEQGKTPYQAVLVAGVQPFDAGRDVVRNDNAGLDTLVYRCLFRVHGRHHRVWSGFCHLIDSDRCACALQHILRCS